MWVGQRRAGLAAVVDDGLGEAQVRRLGVLAEAALQHAHQIGCVVIVERVQAAGVIGGEDEDLVDTAGLGLDMHRAVVVHRERLVAVEGRVQVGHHPHAPLTTLVEPLERRRGGLFVTGAERARTRRVGLDVGCTRGEVGGAIGALGDDGYPAAGEWVQTQLTHSTPTLRPRSERSAEGTREFISPRSARTR